jgi:uncharacterized protein YjiS (DUF1127 family)
MSIIDHYDIITGQPQFSRQLRKQRWPISMQVAVNWFEGRLAKRRSRKSLLRLNDQQLDDIGITREQAFEEGTKGFLD